MAEEISFTLESIRAFPGNDARAEGLPMGSVAVVTAIAHARTRRGAPVTVYGRLDDDQPRLAIGGRTGEGNDYRFVWRFQTVEHPSGTRRVTFTTVASDGTSYGPSEPYTIEVFDMQAPPTVKAAGRMPGEIVRVGDSRELVAGDVLFVRGWAIDLDFPDLASDAVARVDGGDPIALESRQRREDIARQLHLPHASYCGFVGTIPTAGLAPGPHRVELFLYKRHGGRFCETEAVLSFDLLPEQEIFVAR